MNVKKLGVNADFWALIWDFKWSNLNDHRPQSTVYDPTLNRLSSNFKRRWAQLARPQSNRTPPTVTPFRLVNLSFFRLTSPPRSWPRWTIIKDASTPPVSPTCSALTSTTSRSPMWSRRSPRRASFSAVSYRISRSTWRSTTPAMRTASRSTSVSCCCWPTFCESSSGNCFDLFRVLTRLVTPIASVWQCC